MVDPSTTAVRAALQEAARRAETVRLAAEQEAARIRAERDAQAAQNGATTNGQGN
jgi:hypothetical protein